MARYSLVTPSYMPDIALVRYLCASIDKFVAPEIDHILLVPASDWKAFADLQSPRRRVLTQESALPWYFKRFPSPSRLRIPGLVNRPLRQAWLSPYGLQSGWLVGNQIVKLAAPSYCESDFIVLIDSDLEIIRPFDASLFEIDGKVPLYARKAEAMFPAWHRNAARLIGIEPKDYFGADFIGHLVPWRRENILLLQQRIEATMRMPWQLALARLRDVSEMIVYAVFCQEVLKERSGHVFMEGFTKSYWYDNWRNGVTLDSMADELAERQVAVLIQSTVPVDLAERRRVIDALAARGAASAPA